MAMDCITDIVEELAASIFRVEVCREGWGISGQWSRVSASHSETSLPKKEPLICPGYEGEWAPELVRAVVKRKMPPSAGN